jgi:putative FmdB family regulatory protein
MPFYEYQCENCGHDLEVMQKVSDARLKKCPECGKSTLKRLMSAPVFRLKGSGWYETDFKSDQDNKRNLADKAEPDAPKDDKKDSAKTDKKADAPAADAATPAKESKPAADKPAAASNSTVKTPASSSARKSTAKSTARKAPASRKKPAAKSKARR